MSFRGAIDQELPSDRAYTGYIDIEARHLFFYFFESRSDSDKDDVIFWTEGGPGCTTAIGVFMELGAPYALHVSLLSSRVLPV